MSEEPKNKIYWIYFSGDQGDDDVLEIIYYYFFFDVFHVFLNWLYVRRFKINPHPFPDKFSPNFTFSKSRIRTNS